VTHDRPRRWLGTALWLWLGCTALYFVTAPGRIDIIDGGIRFDVTRSMLEVGRPIVRDTWLPGIVGRGGERYSFYPLGTSLIAMPFAALGSRLSGGSIEASQFAFSMTCVPFAAATVALLFLIWGRLGCSRATALRWSLVVALCTPLWPYAGSTFDTVIIGFWLTLAVWAAVEAINRESMPWAIVSGLSFAAMVNIQEIYAVLGACILVTDRVDTGSLRSRLASRATRIIAVGLAAGVGAVLAYNAFKFGNPMETGRTSVGHPLLGMMPIGLIGLFLSPAKIILLYSPTYLFGLLGLRRLIRTSERPCVIVAACLALHIFLTASLKFWAGEWAWGPRYLVVSLPLVCIGLPFVTGRQLRAALAGAVGAGLVVQLLAISVDHQRYYLERSYPSFFWLNERSMYTDSALLARPGELLAVVQKRDLSKVRALAPTHGRTSMTGSPFGAPAPRKRDVPQWMREHLVFVVPRPWPLWSGYLPPALRPGRTTLMTVAGLAVAMVAFGVLGLRLREEDEVSVPVAARTDD